MPLYSLRVLVFFGMSDLMLIEFDALELLFSIPRWMES